MARWRRSCVDMRAFLFLLSSLIAVIVIDADAPVQADSNDRRSLIIGGSAATDLEFPFFVQAKGSMCGGTLVAKDVVLTAAHCDGDFAEKVLVGAWLANETDGTSAQWRGILSGMIIHPQYNNETGENDFMLFRIEPVTNPNLVPIELNTDPKLPNLGDRFSVVGMGYNTSNYTTVDRLLKTQVRFVDHELCQGQWNSSEDDDSFLNETKMVYEESMFCAIGGFSGASGPTKGDSGGPVFDANTKRLLGIVSWGAADPDKWATPFYPSVFARVSTASEWIQNTIRTLTASPTQSPTNVPTKIPTVLPTRFPTRRPTRTPTKLPSAKPTRFPTKAPVGTVEFLGETSFVFDSSNVKKVLRKSLDVNKYPGAKGCVSRVEMTLDSTLLGNGAKISNQIVIGSKFYKPNTLLAGKKSAANILSPCVAFRTSQSLGVSLNATKVVLPGFAFQRKYKVKVKLYGRRV